MAEVLQVIVNGQPREVVAGSSVKDLVAALGFESAQVAVERNKAIVRRAEHGATRLEDGDQLEIVTFFGGG